MKTSSPCYHASASARFGGAKSRLTAGGSRTACCLWDTRQRTLTDRLTSVYKTVGNGEVSRASVTNCGAW